MCCLIALSLAPAAAEGPDARHAAISVLAEPAFEAQDLPGAEATTPDPVPPEWGYLTVSAGPYIGIDESKHLVEVGAEWRFPEYWHLTPLVGATWFEGGDLYAYGGLRWEIPLGDSFYLAPGFALGHYHSGELDLGYPLEFRSSIEVGWQVADSVRLGITAAHLSNADIGEENPGRNSISLTVAFRPVALFD